MFFRGYSVTLLKFQSLLQIAKLVVAFRHFVVDLDP